MEHLCLPCVINTFIISIQRLLLLLVGLHFPTHLQGLLIAQPASYFSRCIKTSRINFPHSTTSHLDGSHAASHPLHAHRMCNCCWEAGRSLTQTERNDIRHQCNARHVGRSWERYGEDVPYIAAPFIMLPYRDEYPDPLIPWKGHFRC